MKEEVYQKTGSDVAEVIVSKVSGWSWMYFTSVDFPGPGFPLIQKRPPYL
jgi:hypothetical protein